MLCPRCSRACRHALLAFLPAALSHWQGPARTPSSLHTPILQNVAEEDRQSLHAHARGEAAGHPLRLEGALSMLHCSRPHSYRNLPKPSALRKGGRVVSAAARLRRRAGGYPPSLSPGIHSHAQRGPQQAFPRQRASWGRWARRRRSWSGAAHGRRGAA